MVTKRAKQEVVTREPTQMAMFTDQMPDWARNGQQRGSENVGTKDLLLPRLEIVQSLSPIRENPDVDAVEGHLYNTVTQSMYGDTVYVVPIFYRMEYLVWKNQDSGGGFFGALDTAGEAEARKAQAIADGEKPEDMEVVDTPVHYCLLVKPDMMTEQIVISMAKSKSKVSRKWNSIIQLGGGDRFSRAYKVTTFKDKNKQNKTFFNYIVSPAGFTPEPIFRDCEHLYSKFREQGVKADHASAAGVEGREDAPGNDSEI